MVRAAGCRIDLGHFGLRDTDEALDNGGIELRAAGDDQATDGLIEGQSFSVRARGDHGIERVDH